MYLLCFPFCWQGIQVWVLIVVQSILIHSASFSNGSKVLQLERLKLQSLETHSCDPLEVSPRKSQLGLCCCCRGFSFSPCVWFSLTHTLLPSLTACIQVPSSHCGAESNVTGPGCSVLPPPSKGPVSAEGNHHCTGSLGREREGGSVWKEGKMWRSGQPIWEATCSLLGLHLLLGLCYWTCCWWLKWSGVQSYKTPAGTVWVAGSDDTLLSERSVT